MSRRDGLSSFSEKQPIDFVSSQINIILPQNVLGNVSQPLRKENKCLVVSISGRQVLELGRHCTLGGVNTRRSVGFSM